MATFRFGRFSLKRNCGTRWWEVRHENLIKRVDKGQITERSSSEGLTPETTAL